MPRLINSVMMMMMMMMINFFFHDYGHDLALSLVNHFNQKW